MEQDRNTGFPGVTSGPIWEPPPCGFGNTPAAAAVKGHPERIDVLVRGVDGQLWQIAWAGSSWSEWVQVPGGSNIGSAPTAVSRYPGSLDVFYGNDTGTVVRSWTSSSGWSDETVIDDYVSSPPRGVNAWSEYRIDLAVKYGMNIAWKHWDAPPPAIGSIVPSDVPPESPTTTIGVYGSGFYPPDAPSGGSRVHLHMGAADQDLSTTFVSETQLTADVPDTYLGTPGTFASITVINPSDGAGGGGTSNAKNFCILYPAPSITGTTPGSSEVGDPAFGLVVTGTNFVSDQSRMYVDGIERSWATCDSPTQFTLPLIATELDHAGAITLQVKTANPGSSVTSDSDEYIYRVGSDPIVTSVSPKKHKHGGKAFPMTITGTGFNPGDPTITGPTSVVLSRAGKRPITGNDIYVLSQNTVVCHVKIPKKAKPGLWDLEVTNPDGASFAAAKAFRIRT